MNNQLESAVKEAPSVAHIPEYHLYENVVFKEGTDRTVYKLNESKYPKHVQVVGKNSLLPKELMREAYWFEVESGTRSLDVEADIKHHLAKIINPLKDELLYKKSTGFQYSVSVTEKFFESKDRYIVEINHQIDYLKNLWKNAGKGYVERAKQELKFYPNTSGMAKELHIQEMERRFSQVQGIFEHIARVFALEGHSGSTYSMHTNLLRTIMGETRKERNLSLSSSGNIYGIMLKTAEKRIAGNDCAFAPAFDTYKKVLILDPNEFDLLYHLIDILENKPLGPLTLTDEEFVFHDHGKHSMYQNIRNSAVFKDANGRFGGKPYFLDSIIFSDNAMDNLHNSWFTRGSNVAGEGSAQLVGEDGLCFSRKVYLDVSSLNLEPGTGADGDPKQYVYIPPKGELKVGARLAKWDCSYLKVIDIIEDTVYATRKDGTQENIPVDDVLNGTRTEFGFLMPLYHIPLEKEEDAA